MKMISRATLLSPILLVTALAFARVPEDRTMQVNIGPTFNFARYNFDNLPQFQGYLAGIHADFAHIKQCREYVGVRFDGRWNAGDVCGCNRDADIKDYRTELDLGYNFDLSWCKMEDLRFTPIVGVGFFYLSDSIDTSTNCCSSSSDCNVRCSSSSDCCGVQYYNIFVPIGFKSEWRVNDCFSLGLDAEYRIDAWTRVKENCGCNKDEVEHRTQGVLLEVPMTWQSGEIWCTDFQVKVVPFFDWNKFGGADHCSTSTGCSSFQSDCGRCSSSCSSTCSSSSVCDPFGCPDSSTLKQWYLGLHVDLGVRF